MSLPGNALENFNRLGSRIRDSRRLLVAMARNPLITTLPREFRSCFLPKHFEQYRATDLHTHLSMSKSLIDVRYQRGGDKGERAHPLKNNRRN